MHATALKRVAIHGVPRSGTSWIGEIFNSSPHTIYRFQPLFSYALKDFLTDTSTRKDVNKFFRRLEDIQDDFISQSAKRSSGDFPQFNKHRITHVIYKEVRYMNILFNLMLRAQDVYLCAVIRNPLSVINSWLKAPREFRADLGWSELEEWRYAPKKNLNKPEEFNGYEKWKESTLLFHQLKRQYPCRVHLLNYASFLSDRLGRTTEMFTSIGLPLTDSTKRFLELSSNQPNNDPYSVYRQNHSDNKWKEELNPIIADQIISDVEGTDLQRYIDFE